MDEYGFPNTHKFLSDDAILEGLLDAEESHRECPRSHPLPVGLDEWPWKGIINWFYEVRDAPVYLVADIKDYPRPWKGEEGWVLETVFGVDGVETGFKRDEF